MAGALVQTPANGAADYTDFITQMERIKKGFYNIDFTTMADGVVAPEIAAGSWIESSGNMYLFGTQEAATGWGGIANSTEAWIKVVPAGTSITAEFTDTAPSFNELRNGWYNGDDRYVLSVYKDAGGDYIRMGIMPIRQSIWDKNGREVLAMQMETKQNTTGYTVAAGADQSIPVTGFSWDPTAALVVQVVYGAIDNQERYNISYPGTMEGTTAVVINSIICTTTEITVGIRNGAGSIIYVEQVIVTAVRAP